MPKSVLSRAHQLFRRKKYSQTIRLLESQVFRYRNNGEFYALLGAACLHTGDFGGAESYLRRAEQLNQDDVDCHLGLAAIAFKRDQIEDAIKSWLKVIDLDPGNRKARMALNALRKEANWEGEVVNSEALNIKNLLPAVPASRWTWMAPLLVACLAAVLVAGYFLIAPLLGNRRRQARPGVEGIVLSMDRPLTAEAAGSGNGGLLSEKEIEERFEVIKTHLLDYRDNLAIREVNALLRSNASSYVKEKARLMKTFAQEPDFTTIRDPFPYLEVRADPSLYADCYVVWRGKAANVQIGEQQIRFDLLVGYEEETELLGLVPVAIDFAALLESGDSIEILGKVQLRNGQITLEGISLHRLYRRG